MRNLAMTTQKSKELTLSHLAETLKSIFSTHKGTTIPFDSLSDKLRDAERGLFISRGIVGENNILVDEVVKRIKQLCEILPDWIRVITSANGTCIKINRTKDMKSVLTVIKSFNN